MSQDFVKEAVYNFVCDDLFYSFQHNCDLIPTTIKAKFVELNPRIGFIRCVKFVISSFYIA